MRTPRLGPTSRDMLAVAESVAVDQRVAVVETSGSMATTTTPGHVRIALIRAGWSLNNAFYSPTVLKASAGKWSKGLQAFADHAPDSEEQDYPSGSIKNLAGVLTSDAVWNEATQCLEADVKLFAPWREALIDMAPYIGMSIRAWVYAQDGEAEGRTGLIVNSIEEARSVDFVTVPAAGGAILSVFESAQLRKASREARNVGHWFESRIHSGFTEVADHMFGDGRLTREERITLSGAVGDALDAFSRRLESDAPQLYKRDPYADAPSATDATPTTEARRIAEATAEEIRADLADEIAEQYGDEDTYTWVRDYDPDKHLVWFNITSGGESATWQQSYMVADDGDCELTGDKVEVMVRTVYDPVEPEDESQPNNPDEESVGAAAAVEPSTPPAAVAVREDVTDGDVPPANSPSSEEGSAVAEVQTGAPPATVVTAPAATAPPVDMAAQAAVLEAMQALTRQVTALTEANTVLARRADERDTADRTRRNRDAAREAVATALAAPEVPQDLREQIGPRVTASVLAELPVTDVGDLDTTALGEAITTAVAAESGYAARLLESAGVGRPRGLGSTSTSEAQTVEAFEEAMAKSFQKLGLNAEAALVAAKGRG
jgi:hypothetical protein